MSSELMYQVSLTLVPHIGPVQARTLLEHFDSAAAIFAARGSELRRIEGIGEVRAASIRRFAEFSIAEEEVAFMNKYGIIPLFITDKRYPQRLLNCYDAPVLLYYKGQADLNDSKIISVVGTRHYTEYGKQLTEKLIRDLSDQKVLVISGLAYGIDAIAHKAALKNELSTVGVLAHGLDLLYPSEHSTLAKDMIKNGGLITEFRRQTKPDKHNFPIRNRIVAGMSDATVVIETGSKGGSMITAELANGYNRDVFAFPGKVTDPKSSGCNSLIRSNKAMLLTEANDLLEVMNWCEQQKPAAATRQKGLFIDLDEDEKKVVEILSEKKATHIDELNLKTGLSSSMVASVILTLELRNVVVSLPGKLYQLS